MPDQGDASVPFQVRLQPSGRTFTATADRTLLSAAVAAGIEIVTSCRNGTCRTCLKPLHAGAVAYRIPWPGLLPEEKTGGWALPCVAYPLSDVVLGD